MELARKLSLNACPALLYCPLPKYSPTTGVNPYENPMLKIIAKLKALFTKDEYQTKSDFISQEFESKDVALGHSYFIDKTKDGGDIKTRWNYEIKPILLEYVRDGILKENALEQIASIEKSIDLKI